MSLENAIQRTGDAMWNLFCPQCGFEFVHIIALTCLRGTDETVITSEGICVRTAENLSRGVRIALEYVCENGHRGRIIFQFHKGVVYLDHESLPDTEDLEGFRDIWRT